MRTISNAILDWFKEHSGFRLYALVLFLLMAGAYLLLVGRMGYNYDDWEGIFLYQQGFSAQQIWNYFLVDRPFSAFVHLLFNPFLRTSVTGWHLLVLILHWAAILFLVKSLFLLFPGHPLPIGWVGFLLALYPGLSRHFVAVTSTPHYLSLFLFSLSLWLMLRACQKEKGSLGLLALSVLLALAQVLIIEYFAALEVVRFFILLFFFKDRFPGKRSAILKKACLTWLPYLAVFTLFLVYKFQILPSLALEEGLTAKHQVGLVASLVQSPLVTVQRYGNLILQDVAYALLHVWLLPFQVSEIDISAAAYDVSWLLGGALALLAALTMWGWYQKDDPELASRPAAWQVLGLCGLTMLLGGLPAWLIGRQATVGIWSSRFLLAPVLGAVPLAVLFFVGLAGQARRSAANLVLAVMLAGAFSLQFREAHRYTLYWDFQYQYYWQLKWRAPGLVPQTFILAPNTPFLRNSDYQIAYGINLIYAPGYAGSASRYWWFDGPDTLRDFATQAYKPGQPVEAAMRNISFSSSMEFALPVLHRASRGCLQALTDTYYQGEPLLSQEENQLFELAGHNLVLPTGADLPPGIFGPEPEHTWCYYYQKAELAREFDDWAEISSLWRQIKAGQFTSQYGPEYAPFIEAFARQQAWSEAVNLTIKAGKQTKEARPYFCHFWQTALSALPGYPEPWQMVQTELSCQ